MSLVPMTLSQFVLAEERRHPGASGEFTGLITDLAIACKVINREVVRAGLTDLLGWDGVRNVHGEKVQRLDAFAHEVIHRALAQTGQLAVCASEESEDVIPPHEGCECGKYVVNFDPLDGSSNIDADVNIGTIFSILPRVTGCGPGTVEDCLQPGGRQVAAGYVIYGPSTILVYTTGEGVHGFTFDPGIGEFLLSHANVRMPERGRIYSANEGNAAGWAPGVRRYVEWLKASEPSDGRPYSSRYVGSLVADFHRNLLYGGIFMYPADSAHASGKLRVLYECSPLAFIAEQAGGAATDGRRRILEIVPRTLHERTPLFIGSRRDVRECAGFMAEG
ncbi:MAG: class 1 fructose-bisphosphatase [Candidatus Eisenbacteria bacterium]|nr:class 1 fructose-bisphosphatase [Candidatus Eisenbacteria bacterium]